MNTEPSRRCVSRKRPRERFLADGDEDEMHRFRRQAVSAARDAVLAIGSPGDRGWARSRLCRKTPARAGREMMGRPEKTNPRLCGKPYRLTYPHYFGPAPPSSSGRPSPSADFGEQRGKRRDRRPDQSKNGDYNCVIHLGRVLSAKKANEDSHRVIWEKLPAKVNPLGRDGTPRNPISSMISVATERGRYY